MLRVKFFALPALATALALATVPALAQAPAGAAAQIALTEGEAFAAHTVIGDVRAEVHQSSLFPKVSSRELADQQLREKALQMGADAVIGIKYENNSAMFSKKGFIATGKAVKYAVALAAAPAPAAVPLPPVLSAASTPTAPVIAATLPAPAAVAALPPGIPLIEGAAPWAHTVLGAVRAEIHQKSLLPSTPSRDLADQELRAQAAKLGADAIINVKYENNNPMFSKRGFLATGTAVKVAAAAAPAPVQPAIAPPVEVSAAPPVQIPAAPPVVTPAVPATAPAAAPAAAPAVAAPATAPTAAAGIQLSEQNLARAYAVLGPVNAELDPAAVSLEKTGKQVLDDELRNQAAKLGADAVILVKYTASASGKGPAAIGVAVKFN